MTSTRLSAIVGFDPVMRGTLITRMSGRPTTPLDERTKAELQGALSAASAAIGGAAASLAQSQRDLARADELAQRGFLAKAQLEAARTRVTTDQSTLAQSRAEAARIRAMLSQGGAASDQTVAVLAPTSGSEGILNAAAASRRRSCPPMGRAGPDSAGKPVPLPV